MSKQFMLYVTLIMAALGAIGCGSRGDYKEWHKEVEASDCYFPDKVDVEAPGWVCTEVWEGSILSAVGSYHRTDAGIDFQKTMAMTEARARLSEMSRLKFEQLVRQYASSETTGAGEQSQRDDTLVRRQITSTKMPGTELYAMTVNPETERMYVIVGLNQENSQRYINQIMSEGLEFSSSEKSIEADKALSEAVE